MNEALQLLTDADPGAAWLFFPPSRNHSRFRQWVSIWVVFLRTEAKVFTALRQSETPWHVSSCFTWAAFLHFVSDSVSPFHHRIVRTQTCAGPGCKPWCPHMQWKQWKVIVWGESVGGNCSQIQEAGKTKGPSSAAWTAETHCVIHRETPLILCHAWGLFQQSDPCMSLVTSKHESIKDLIRQLSLFFGHGWFAFFCFVLSFQSSMIIIFFTRGLTTSGQVCSCQVLFFCFFQF